MAKGVTTSIRLDSELSHRLEKMAHDLRRGKNWLISEALRKYLEQLETPSLIKEAKRQSLLASRQKNPEIDLWEENSDHTGWSAQ